ncbi:PP2C family protein-serine/threonine phosphatase [Labedaea rhizosphaerae]|uniref:Stage II sporulation protein E n=1 Tax=Labedaea rhizosphaerae TaxID=598644 RepID=A0A4R6SGB3_LABRH|nr:GAF domain-containing SpoIIE family protein phosphatase [Labedaea rhizosphaerae]TDQ00714.1 stage II sporulation protein E [Labedaea rhizosphaerae]
MVDADGVVEAVNDLAADTLPDEQPGAPLSTSWLAAAHVTRPGPVEGPVEGRVGERTFEAQPAPGPDGTTMWWLVDVTALRDAQRALRIEQRRTEFLGQTAQALTASLNVERSMETAAQLATTHLADAAVVVAPQSRNRLPAVFCVHGGEPVHALLAVDPEDLPGLAEAMQGYPPVPSRWIDPAAAPAWLLPEGMTEVGSIMVIPLPGHGVPAGALVLLGRAGRTAFTDDEVVAGLFAARCGAAMSAAWMYAQQASITETLMRDLLPPTLRRVGGVEFAGRYHAAREFDRVGGDFYDVHVVGDPGADQVESLTVLGDVCGKGLTAAVLTGKIRSTLHALLPMAHDHQQMLSLLNGALYDRDNTMFVTLVLVSAVRHGGGVRLRVTCAGHPAPLVVRAGGEVEAVGIDGHLIGVLPEVESTTAEVLLAPGETCLLYTDGITEARGGPLGDTMFDDERLHQALAHCAGMPADALAEHVHMRAAQWVGAGHHDDMALVAITAPPDRAGRIGKG